MNGEESLGQPSNRKFINDCSKQLATMWNVYIWIRVLTSEGYYGHSAKLSGPMKGNDLFDSCANTHFKWGRLFHYVISINVHTNLHSSTVESAFEVYSWKNSLFPASYWDDTFQCQFCFLSNRTENLHDKKKILLDAKGYIVRVPSDLFPPGF